MIKTNFKLIEMTGTMYAEDIVSAVFEALDKVYIPRSNVVTISTDGCSTMLGSINGVHAIMRKALPHLPDWGGCMAHSPSNMLKAATPFLGESFIKVCSTTIPNHLIFNVLLRSSLRSTHTCLHNRCTG